MRGRSSDVAARVGLLVLVVVAWARTAAADAAPGELYLAPGDYPAEPPAEVERLWPRDQITGPVEPGLRREQAMSFVLGAEDLLALAARCPQDDLRVRLTCLYEPDVQADIDRRLRRSVLEHALARLDVDLAPRLGATRDAVAAACAPAVDGWLACAVAERYNAPACTPARRAIDVCLAHDDDVVEAYLDVVAAKKLAFGRARFARFARLLTGLPLPAVAEVGAACPQRETDELFACLQRQASSGPAARAAARDIRDLAGLGTAGAGPDHLRRTTELLLAVPNLDPIFSACAVEQPALVAGTVPPVELPRALDELYGCVARTAETDPVANPAYIDPARMRAWLGAARGKVVTALRDAELAHQRAASRRIALAFGVLAALGALAVIALPWSRRRGAAAPARVRLTAGVALAGSLLVIGGAMLAMRELQGRLAAESTSPRTRIAEGTFRVLEQPAFIARFSEASRHRVDLIKRPLREIVRADRDEVARRYTGFALRLAIHWAGLLDEPELHARHGGDAAEAASGHGATIRRTFGLYRVVDGLMGLVPFLLAVVAALVYLWPLRATLRAIAGGEETAARARALVSGELRAVALFLAIALALLPAGGWVLARAVEPLIELVLTHALMALAYVGAGGASTPVLVTSLGATMLLLGLCVGLFLAAIALYLSALRKVLHAIFHGGERFADHRRFWIAGTVAVVGLVAFPLAFALTVRGLAGGPLAPDQAAPGAGDMLLVPVGALVALPLALWALRGARALAFLRGLGRAPATPRDR